MIVETLVWGSLQTDLFLLRFVDTNFFQKLEFVLLYTKIKYSTNNLQGTIYIFQQKKINCIKSLLL